jgi:hypothetical protein
VRAGTRVNRVVGHDESSGKGTRQAAEDIIGKVLEVILGRALIWKRVMTLMRSPWKCPKVGFHAVNR